MKTFNRQDFITTVVIPLGVVLLPIAAQVLYQFSTEADDPNFDIRPWALGAAMAFAAGISRWLTTLATKPSVEQSHADPATAPRASLSENELILPGSRREPTVESVIAAAELPPVTNVGDGLRVTARRRGRPPKVRPEEE